jgi:hypothetical protein
MVPQRPGPDAVFRTRLKWWGWCFITWYTGMPREGLAEAAARSRTAILLQMQQAANSAREKPASNTSSEDPGPP